MNAELKVILFDLDGTLLDTLDDLTDSVNYALRSYGMPERTRAEVRRFLGNGIRVLMEKSVPEATPSPLFEDVFTAFRTYYVAHSMCKTDLYEGIRPMLRQLRAAGLKLGIVSNKMQEAVTDLYHRFFEEEVAVAIGEGPGVCRKPAPDAVQEALRRLACSSNEALYVGDSEVDIATAKNAAIRCLSVSWGFRDADFLLQNGAENLIAHPSQLYPYVAQLNGWDVPPSETVTPKA